MSDISKCSGLRLENHKAIICPFRRECKRFLANTNEPWQSWIEPPFTEADCEMFYQEYEPVMVANRFTAKGKVKSIIKFNPKMNPDEFS